MSNDTASFAQRLLAWFDVHGRHDLPWQQERTPYTVWLSEVMLQQTQVSTVIPYFQRFTAQFPTLQALAGAELDEVLSLWSGLGYYARARNLHHCAQHIVNELGGEFPQDSAGLQALPGIGRSTANAILAQTLGARLPILDGNVRRVMARHAAIAGSPQAAAVQKRLWAESEARLPEERLADYTQAIMDLGASLCTRARVACDRCPVADDCQALQLNQVAQLPNRAKRAARGKRVWTALVERDGRSIRLVRRPPSGIWGGLWCLPIIESAPQAGQTELRQLDHAFSHFDLQLVAVAADKNTSPAADSEDAWFTLSAALRLGLPQPIRLLIEQLDTTP